MISDFDLKSLIGSVILIWTHFCLWSFPTLVIQKYIITVHYNKTDNTDIVVSAVLTAVLWRCFQQPDTG